MKLKYVKYNIFHLRNYLYLLLVTLGFSLLIACIKIIDENNNQNSPYKWLQHQRNVSSYLNRSSKKQQSESLCNNVEVLIGVISAPHHSNERSGIRNSWAKYKHSTWKIVFFIGKSTDYDIQKRIQEEMQIYQDIVMLDINDSYQMLSVKIILLLQWMNLQCEQPKFLLKVDDDVYINTMQMQEFISCCSCLISNQYCQISSKCSRWNPESIIGFTRDSRSILPYLVAGYRYDGIKPDRNPSSKWYLDLDVYKPKELPSFLSGTSYIMSANLIPYILEKAIEIPLINLEDVYITGIIMRQSLGLKLSHVSEWSNFRPLWDDVCLYKSLLTAHGLNPKEMVEITNSVHNLKGECNVTQKLYSYFNKIVSHYIPRYKL